MDETTPGRVRLSAAEACALAQRALEAIGYDMKEARIVTDHVVDAALCGHDYSGLPKILNVALRSQATAPAIASASGRTSDRLSISMMASASCAAVSSLTSA